MHFPHYCYSFDEKRSSTPFCVSPLFTIDGLLRDLKMVRSVVSRRLSLLSRRSSFHGTSSSSRPLITPRVLSSSTVSLDRYSVCNRFARFHDNAGGGFPLNASVNHQQSQRWFSAEPAHNDDKPTADDSLGIATGLEREELKAKQEGRVLFDLEPPRGPFGTKDAPATVESVFDERLVGCCGGPGEDEHDVIWFNLKKEENFECPICSQYFQLKVVGPGGMPGDHHHH